MTRCRLLALALVLVACSGDVRDAEGLPSEPLPVIEVAPAPRLEQPVFFDDHGRLLASEERVAGLTLPVGLTATGSADERVHTYLSSQIPIGAFLRYFGPRLTTGQVEEQPGGGATYRAAVPREVESGAVSLDVAIMPVPVGQVLIEIRELPPPPASPPSQAESIRALTTAMEHEE